MDFLKEKKINFENVKRDFVRAEKPYNLLKEEEIKRVENKIFHTAKGDIYEILLKNSFDEKIESQKIQNIKQIKLPSNNIIDTKIVKLDKDQKIIEEICFQIKINDSPKITRKHRNNTKYSNQIMITPHQSLKGDGFQNEIGAFGVNSEYISQKDVDLVISLLKIIGRFNKLIPQSHEITFFSV